MKTIGLLGGMSWESTVPYYQIINRCVAEKLGELHSAKILLHSVDFAELEALMRREDWDAIAQTLASAAQGLQSAGAQLVALCTNTMHKVANQISSAVDIPMLHIADATALALAKDKACTVGLLGTRFTMQQDFYKSRLWSKGVEVLLPDEWQMQEVDRIIFEELCRGIFAESSKTFLLALVQSIAAQGAHGIVLGCTEIGLLLSQQDTDVPLYDTTDIHARHIARMALKE